MPTRRCRRTSCRPRSRRSRRVCLRACGTVAAFVAAARRARKKADGRRGERRARWQGSLDDGGQPRRSSRRSTSRRTPLANAPPIGWPTTTPRPATHARRWARAAGRHRGPRTSPTHGRVARPGFDDARWSYLYKSATPSTRTPDRLTDRSRRRTADAQRPGRRYPGADHPRARVDAGRSRPTSGSAGWRRARRSSRSPATWPVTTAPPRSHARSRSAPWRRRRSC